MTPVFLLIDHGHFQYNNVMLGFTLWALTMFAYKKYALSVMFLMLSISFKQMNIYSVPAFGAAHLGVGLSHGNLKSTVYCYLKWGLVAITTLVACFSPFLGNLEMIFIIIKRLFPVNRGLFEQKVANFWCTISILTKIHTKYPKEDLFKFCLTFVIISLSPMIVGLISLASKGRLTIQKFILGLSYACLVMFMFSYHVHEKQILIPLLPITFLSSQFPWFVYLFTIWSAFSLYPLMRMDNLQIAYFSILLVWNGLFYLVNRSKISKITREWKLLIVFSISFITLSHVAQFVWTPPSNLPDLFMVFNSLSSSGVFGLSLPYLLYKFYE